MTQQRRERLIGTASALLFGLAAASLAAVLAPLGWPLELFAHFRWQLAAAAVVAWVAAIVLRHRSLVVLAVLATLLQAVPPMRALRERAAVNPAPSQCRGPAFTVATLNLEYSNDDRQRAIAWLAANPADVVVLQEVTEAWARAIGTGLPAYAYSRILTREDPYGIALLSRRPFVQVRAADLAHDGLPSIVATVSIAGRPVQVLGLHTHWPITPRLYRSRNRALTDAAAITRSARIPSVLAGDLNLTPYAPTFGRLLASSGLRNAMAGQAWQPTWEADFWPLALPIDHVLVPSTSCVTYTEVGPDVGSDHRPVRVTLRLR